MNGSETPEGWIREDELVAATRIARGTLVRWRDQGLIVRWKTLRLGFAIGTGTYYDPITIAVIKRLYRLRKDSHDFGEWRWQLWIEEFPVDVIKWLRREFTETNDKIASIRNLDQVEDAIDLEKLKASKLPRHHPLRPIMNAVRSEEMRLAIVKLVFSFMLGIPPSASEPSHRLAFGRLTEAIEFPGDNNLPDAFGSGPPLFQAIQAVLEEPSEDEEEFARDSCRKLAKIILGGGKVAELSTPNSEEAKLIHGVCQILDRGISENPAFERSIKAMWSAPETRPVTVGLLILTRRLIHAARSAQVST